LNVNFRVTQLKSVRFLCENSQVREGVWNMDIVVQVWSEIVQCFHVSGEVESGPKNSPCPHYANWPSREIF